MAHRPFYVICKAQNHKKCAGHIMLVDAMPGARGGFYAQTPGGRCEHCGGKLRMASRGERIAYREWLSTQSEIEEAK